MVKLVTSKLVVDAMNAIAKEKAEAMSPNQVDLEVGSDQQSTENEVEESEVAPNEDPAEIYPELQPETQVEIPPEILEENEEERQEPVEKQVQKKGEEQRTVTTRLGREIRQPTRYLAVTNLSKQDWKKTEADRAIKAELTTLFKVGSYDMYLRCWRALAP
jgi:midasin (ATPase involved in ribosome maturation)